MIPKECKRLIEIDLPIAIISISALKREKKFPIPRGHPSTLHHWWARRPLAVCRAVLLGLLLPDPCDSKCPKDFNEKACKALSGLLIESTKNNEELRNALLKFIADFSDWNNSSNPIYNKTARDLVKAIYKDEPPFVVDPFAGGGSIPLEALRLGCDTFASDLNPVACLILKVMLEDIPKNGPEIISELRKTGIDIKNALEKELKEFYPNDPDSSHPIAYIWARTIRCESPNCGAEIPLIKSLWLAKKEVWIRKDKKRIKIRGKQALRYKIEKQKNKPPEIIFEIFEPKNESEVPSGTVARAKAKCLCCGAVLPPDRVRSQLSIQHGGADVIFDDNNKRINGSRLLAVVTIKPKNNKVLGDFIELPQNDKEIEEGFKEYERGRRYRLSTDLDYDITLKAITRLKERTKKKLSNGLNPVPDESTPKGGGSGAGRAFSVQKYGIMTWGDLFTSRQKLALVILTDLISKISKNRQLYALTIGKIADFNCSLSQWRSSAEDIGHLFGRQALPITWDFVETNMCGSSYVNFNKVLDYIIQVIEYISQSILLSGQTQQANACFSPLPDDVASIWFTDPPYYDAVPYADLSDFFFVWLKRSLIDFPLTHDSFKQKNGLTPKIEEIVEDEAKDIDGRPKDRLFFETSMAHAFVEGRRILKDDGIGCIVFAHKTTEGWEALLSGMIKGGWYITASWPIATEMGSRLRARDSAALATSIHLICRPRSENTSIGDWNEILRELPKRVGDWMNRLQHEGVRGADLVFACIGPALELYSKYSKVVDAQDREIPLGGDPEEKEPYKRGYLAYVWETVGRGALQQILGTDVRARNGNMGALEEDARLTALFLWTLQSTETGIGQTKSDQEQEEPEEDEEGTTTESKKKGYRLIHDIVRRFAQPLGIHLENWEGRIIDTEKGVVRLLPVAERAKQLFGTEGTEKLEKIMKQYKEKTTQLTLLMDEPETPKKISSRKELKGTQIRHNATTLDRVHMAMILQANGQAGALRELVAAEENRGPEFLRLANALSALYPKESEEKRLLDAMISTVPRS